MVILIKILNLTLDYIDHIFGSRGEDYSEQKMESRQESVTILILNTEIYVSLMSLPRTALSFLASHFSDSPGMRISNWTH